MAHTKGLSEGEALFVIRCMAGVYEVYGATP